MKTQNKNLFSWLVYDLGNSFFVTAISGLFLAQWLILDNKLDDIWYGAGFSIATIFVLLTSPFFGAWSDKLGKRMPFLKWSSLALFFFNGLIAFTAVSSLPQIQRAFIVLGLSIVVQYLYQMSLIFYNSLLKEISTEKNRGKISGLGEGFNSLGWLIGSVVLLPFANGVITLIGEPGRHQVFIPAFIISTLLMLPMLFTFKEQSQVLDMVSKESVSKKTFEGIKQLFHENRNVGIFLLGFSFISDLMLTVELFFAVVMDALYRIDDNSKTLVFAINLVCTIILGYIFGKLGDKYGHKKILLISCGIFIISMIIFFTSSSLNMLYLVGVASGAGVGGYYVNSRALMIRISPQDRLGAYFGFYSTFARIASVTGPLIWGGITLLLRNEPVLKYQVAGMVMVGLLIIGSTLLLRVKEETKINVAG